MPLKATPRTAADEPARSDGKIDLNSAAVGTLTQLPGVAKNVAYAIVNYRNLHGGFSAWEDLQKISCFPFQKIAALQRRAFLGPRPEPVSVERPVISRWWGKEKHDPRHLHGTENRDDR